MASARLSNQNQSVDVAREAALAFSEADSNGDGVLEWHEFIEAISRIRKQSGGLAPQSEDEAKFRALASAARTMKNASAGPPPHATDTRFARHRPLRSLMSWIATGTA